MSTRTSPDTAANGMSGSGSGSKSGSGSGSNSSSRPAPSRTRRLSTETKAAFKTTEFFAFIAIVIATLIAAAMVDESNAGGFGAQQAWLYVAILTVGYMVSRGLAKSGSRDPYDADDDR